MSIYVVITGVDVRYRRRLCDFLWTRPFRQKNHTYCVKCSLPRATTASPSRQAQSSLPRRSVGFLTPRIGRPLGATLALRTLSAGDRSGSHGPGGSWTLMDDGWWREGIMYYSYVSSHCRVFTYGLRRICFTFFFTVGAASLFQLSTVNVCHFQAIWTTISPEPT